MEASTPTMTIKKFEFWTTKNIGKNKDVSVFTLMRYIGIFPIAFDIVGIKYRQGSELPMHRDPVNGFKTIRFNLVLNSTKGGEFICDSVIFRSRYLNIFRPDINIHGVSEVVEGTRYMFSLGLGIKI